MTQIDNLPRLECSDENPKIVTRIIRFISQSYCVDICEHHKNNLEFQGQDIKNIPTNDIEISSGEKLCK